MVLHTFVDVFSEFEQEIAQILKYGVNKYADKFENQKTIDFVNYVMELENKMIAEQDQEKFTL
jgi:hypothetical protein